MQKEVSPNSSWKKIKGKTYQEKHILSSLLLQNHCIIHMNIKVLITSLVKQNIVNWHNVEFLTLNNFSWLYKIKVNKMW